MTTSNRPISRAREILRGLTVDLPSLLSLVYLVLLFACAILAPVIAPYSPIEQRLEDVLLPPNADHWLGTDDLGRDTLSRLIHGAPVSLYATFLAVGIAVGLGVPIGVVAGYVGGWVDQVIGRIIDTLLSFPGIILAIGVTGVLGIGLTNSMIAIGIVLSPILARLARAQALIVKSELYVDAARCFGSSPMWIITRHVLPNTIQPVIVQVTLLLALALLAESSLSFLGLGVQPPQASWGQMLARGYNYMEIAPEQLWPPGLAILFTSLAFNTLGARLRDVLDPASRGRA